MTLAKLHVQVIHFLLGPYTTQIREAAGEDKRKLLKITGKEFELEIFYEINTYSRVYKRWWVPTSRRHVIKLTAGLRGNAPERLRQVCDHYLHLPYDGKVEDPSALELYNASSFYLEFLTMRGLNL